jgi:hypothetical protein
MAARLRASEGTKSLTIEALAQLAVNYSQAIHCVKLEDPNVRRIRQLLAEATALQESATKLIAEITDQLQRSIFMHDDRGGPRERAAPEVERPRKPRST